MKVPGTTPVKLDEEGVKVLEKLLERQQRLMEANKELVMKWARTRDFITVRTLEDIK